MKAHLNRRNFVRVAAAATAVAAQPSLFAQTSANATFTFTRKTLATVPLDFNGLSYESPQLANPAFFSPTNTGLVRLFRELTPHGVLRTGGNLSATTGWHDDPSQPVTAAEQSMLDKGRRFWEWDLTDSTIRSGDHTAIFTPASIKNLAAFLEATGWKLIYGLNFATGTPEQAASEAACVQQLVGKNLIAFQLGNELDFWGGGFRPKPWTFDDFYAQWTDWVRVIRAKAPNAPFAGPDTAVNLDWMERLAAKHPDGLVLLSKHHYAMGPAGDPTQDAHKLLGPDPNVAQEIAAAQRATALSGIRFRNTECNSCYHGGQRGVSDAYASALWGADYMLTLAQGGHAGVNFHGGGNGHYAPIVGDPANITARPLYFGMQFAQTFAGATLVESSLFTTANATAYAAHREDETLIALISKDATPLQVMLDKKSLGNASLASVSSLSAPALSSLTGVTFKDLKLSTHQRSQLVTQGVAVPPYTALLLRFHA